MHPRGSHTYDGEVGQAADLAIALAHPAGGLEAMLKALHLQELCQHIWSDCAQIGWQCLQMKTLKI